MKFSFKFFDFRIGDEKGLMIWEKEPRNQENNQICIIEWIKNRGVDWMVLRERDITWETIERLLKRENQNYMSDFLEGE